MELFFFSSRRRHTRCSRDWSSDVCSSDLWPRAILLQQDRPRPPPRRPDRVLAPVDVVLRKAALDAAAPAQRRRPQRRHPAALLRGGDRGRRLRGRDEVSTDPLRPLWLAGEPPAEARQEAA